MKRLISSEICKQIRDVDKASVLKGHLLVVQRLLKKRLKKVG